jgi:hypothetical protein
VNRAAILITVLAFGIILVGCGGSETADTEKKSTTVVTPNANASTTVNAPVSNAASTAANTAVTKTADKDADDIRGKNTQPAANNTNRKRDADDKSRTDKDRDNDRDADDQ